MMKKGSKELDWDRLQSQGYTGLRSKESVWAYLEDDLLFALYLEIGGDPNIFYIKSPFSAACANLHKERVHWLSLSMASNWMYWNKKTG